MSNKIKEYRQKLKMSQLELAQKSGISRNTISKLENGHQEVITNATMFKIAEVLGKNVKTIFF